MLVMRRHPPAISTHALREEGDGAAGRRGGGLPAISTHALREEGDWGTADAAPPP